MQRVNARRGQTFRIVQHKCPKCGRQHGVKYKDGKPITDNPVCRKCGNTTFNLDDKRFANVKGSLGVKAVA